ncbi:hypothetical protein ACFLYM_02085 [Chloroflexota bacterium]
MLLPCGIVDIITFILACLFPVLMFAALCTLLYCLIADIADRNKAGR